MKTCPTCHLRYPVEAVICLADGAPLEALRDARLDTTIGGRYVLDEVIGEGGMSTVYRARDTMLDRVCAVKVMTATLASDSVLRERFRREAKSAERLTHPNIIEVLDHGDTDDSAFLVMEYLHGVTLSRIIVDGPMMVRRALGIMIQVARGIARAHDLEVVHRDLKPDNIFLCRLDDGTEMAKLLDFGIARFRHDARLTQKGELFGTPQYMAPERISQAATGPSIDLYALGVIFYEMLTGQLPFDAPDIATFFVKHLNAPAPPPSHRVLGVPAALDALVLALLAKDPRERPVDAHRVGADLAAIAAEVGAAMPPKTGEWSHVRFVSTAPTGDLAAPLAQGPPTEPGIDSAEERSHLLAQVLARAYDGALPPEATRAIARTRAIAAELADVRGVAAERQRALLAIDRRAREHRQRFGIAVDALGADVSRQRDELRVSQTLLALAREEASDAGERFTAMHKETLFLEGRTGLQEPTAALAEAYRAVADAVDTWLHTKDEEKRAAAACATHERAVSDLEFQVHELLGALAAQDASVEEERSAAEKALAEASARADLLEGELVAITTTCCEPFRARADLAPLVEALSPRAA